MTSGHFIFIPAVLLIGIVIGWILGGRAARDAFAQMSAPVSGAQAPESATGR